MRRLALLTSLVLLLWLLGGACRSNGFGGREVPLSSIRWPAEGEGPRVEVLYTYEGTSQPGGERGVLTRVKDWVIGKEVIRFVSPYGLALTEDGVLLVADAGLGGVHAIEFDKRTHKFYAGSDRVPMVTPIGVAVGPGGRIFVTDSTACCVHILSPNGEHAGSFGDAKELGRPTGIAYDSVRDRLLIADTTGGRILSYSRDGSQLEVLGGRGEETGQFNYPTNITVDRAGRIFVVDTMNFRVQVFTVDFEREEVFGLGGDGPGAFARPKGIALNSEGHVFVVDALFDNVQIFTEQGALLLTVGARGTGFGGFSLPTGILIDDQDRIFVADSGNARIQALRYERGTQ